MGRVYISLIHVNTSNKKGFDKTFSDRWKTTKEYNIHDHLSDVMRLLDSSRLAGDR